MFDSIGELIGRINQYVLNPVILVLFAVATLIFLWGIFQFIAKVQSDSDRETGKRHIMWGLVGMFIMISVFGIIKVILDTIGVAKPPTLP
ncbi:hypothetical protein KW783_00945 [Candidatus Parcubacteria bacterium]|nr:hypothetical protein [Candidatus Parcubacteria bacterium]